MPVLPFRAKKEKACGIYVIGCAQQGLLLQQNNASVRFQGEAKTTEQSNLKERGFQRQCGKAVGRIIMLSKPDH